MKKRVFAVLLTLCMVLGLLPVGVLAGNAYQPKVQPPTPWVPIASAASVGPVCMPPVEGFKLSQSIKYARSYSTKEFGWDRGVQFEYDENGNLLAENDLNEDGSTKPVYKYAYDSQGRCVKSVNTRTELSGSIGSGYGTATYETKYIYDDNGDAVRGETTRTFEKDDGTIITGDVPSVTNYTYDANHNLISIEYESGTKTDYIYDSNGNLIESNDTASDGRKYTYDSANRLLAVNGRFYTYDENGYVIRETQDMGDEPDMWTDYTNDAEGKPVKCEYYSYGKGDVQEGDQILYYTYLYEYDQYGNQTKISQYYHLTGGEPQLEAVVENKYTKIGAELVTSGSCGENVTWNFDQSTGTLTISGTGAMKEDYVNNNAPWYEFRDEIQKVVIEEGMTNTGYGAFRDLSITAVSLPNSLEEISWYSFNNCVKLKNVTLPGNLKLVAEKAFTGAGLETVVIPEGVTKVGIDTFYGCENLKSVMLPSSIRVIDDYSFGRCNNLTDVYYGGTEAEWAALCNQPESEWDMGYVARNSGIHPDGNKVPTFHYAEADKPTVPTSTFVDVQDTPATNWYYTPVLWAVANNVTNGISDTEFAPNNTCTRAQAVAFLWRAAGRPEPSSTVNPFVDVVDTSDTNWYYKAVLWAVEKGITTGTDATHFSPEGEVSRGQMVTFLWRMHEKPTAEGSIFADVPANEYYYNAVSWAVSQGITNGTDEAANTFEPLTTCSRAHIVTFLYRDIAA